jgi:two-component system, LytTR family, sensor kinase
VNSNAQLTGGPEVWDADLTLKASDHFDRKTAIAAIIITIAFWLTNFAVQTRRSLLDHHPNLWDLSLARLGTMLCGFAMCYAMHRIFLAMRRRPFWQRAVVLVLLVPAVGDSCAWITYLLNPSGVVTAAGTWPTPGATLQTIVYWCWFIMAWGALYLALGYSMEVQAYERRARQIQGLAHAAQMRALHNQINPHFMFNTLNSISALILDGDQIASEAMVTRLAEFLRATLALDPLTDISLAEELRIQQLYLDIEQIRFPDLDVTIDCDDDAARQLVPPLILQPVIENAVKHGVAARRGRSTIALAAHGVGDVLEIRVDNVRADTARRNGLGLGLQNVAARLTAHYGAANVSFEAGEVGEHDYRVTMRLPKHEAN